MEFRLLEYVVKVAEERSFSKAAKKLHITQPSLSQQISKLEKKLGLNLFNRNTSSVRLTSAGETFVETAIKILDMTDQLKKEMSDVANLNKGRLTIGSMSMTGAHLLPFIIPVFKDMFPGIEVVLVEDTTENLEIMTAKGQVDLSLLSLPLTDLSLQYEIIMEEQILLAIPPNHKWRERKKILLSEAMNEPFIFIKHGQGFHDISLNLCNEAGFEPKIVFESSNIETIQSLVCAGMGVALVPKMVVRSNSSSFTPVYIPIVDPVPARTLVFAYKNDRYLSKSAEAFMRLMKQNF